MSQKQCEILKYVTIIKKEQTTCKEHSLIKN